MEDNWRLEKKKFAEEKILPTSFDARTIKLNAIMIYSYYPDILEINNFSSATELYAFQVREFKYFFCDDLAVFS